MDYQETIEILWEKGNQVIHPIELDNDKFKFEKDVGPDEDIYSNGMVILYLAPIKKEQLEGFEFDIISTIEESGMVWAFHFINKDGVYDDKIMDNIPHHYMIDILPKSILKKVGIDGDWRCKGLTSRPAIYTYAASYRTWYDFRAQSYLQRTRNYENCLQYTQNAPWYIKLNWKLLRGIENYNNRPATARKKYS